MQGIPWWSSGQDLALSLPWCGFTPWSGNEDPASCAARPKIFLIKKENNANLNMLNIKSFQQEFNQYILSQIWAFTYLQTSIHYLREVLYTHTHTHTLFSLSLSSSAHSAGFLPSINYIISLIILFDSFHICLPHQIYGGGALSILFAVRSLTHASAHSGHSNVSWMNNAGILMSI